MAGERQEKRTSPGEKVAKGTLELGKHLMDEAGEHMLRDVPRAARFVLKRIPGAPGLVYDIAKFGTAKDKLRAGIEIAGGLAGGAAGGALGAAAGGVNAPIGAALGSAAGEELATDYYDKHQAEIRQGVDATRQWIEQRNADVRRRFGR